MNITTNDLIYCAGVIDAKAHIATHRIARSSHPRDELVITTRHKAIAEKLRNTFGCGTVHRRRQDLNSWNWKVYGEHVQTILAFVLPYLVAQRERALLLIEFPTAAPKGKRP
jgi:hypothetical protein